MDWILILFLAILVVFIILIFITLVSLPQLGDERKKFIKMKAQSYAFSIVIALLVFEIGKSVYFAFWSEKSYQGISPIPFLIGISAVYLITLLIYKKKYGD